MTKYFSFGTIPGIGISTSHYYPIHLQTALLVFLSLFLASFLIKRHLRSGQALPILASTNAAVTAAAYKEIAML